MKLGKNIESRPISIFSIVALFFFILFAESLLGGIFYSQALKYLATNYKMASRVINIGLIITKLAILLSLYRLVFYKNSIVLENTEKKLRGIGKFIGTRNLLLCLRWVIYAGIIVFLYRMAFDSFVGLLLMQWIGPSEDLTRSMYLILGAPVLGYSYILLTAPVFEEIIYRGIFYDGLRKHGYSAAVASVFSAILFAVMHLNILQGVNAFVLGILTAYVYEQTKNIFAPIVLHVFNNIYVTFCSSTITNIQWINSPVRILIMVASLLLLMMFLRFIKGFNGKTSVPLGEG